MRTPFAQIVGLGALLIAFLSATVPAAQRPFLMGTSIFTDFFQFAFENPEDKDLYSLHQDDFMGIPWANFQNGTALPSAWVGQWTTIQTGAANSGKVIYLAVSPLKDRKTLTGRVDANGAKVEDWAPVDANGCYPFATDPNAEVYKQAYIRYLKWIVDRIHPTYVSPVVEMNLQFKQCPAQKAAFKQWYADVHQALKTSYPDLVVFPTFQAENMYGVSDAQAWCGGTKTDASLAACFQERLDEALALPGDRIAFSLYPAFWKVPPTAPDSYTVGWPAEDMFSRVQRATRRKIWISETGWGGVQIYGNYAHGLQGCGTVFLSTPTVFGDENMTEYLTQLLAQAQSKRFEAVVWWENRDYLETVVAAGCPCLGSNPTCTFLETFYQLGGGGAGGNQLEFAARVFGNMGLRTQNGTPRPGVHAVWRSYLNEPYSPAPNSNAPLGSIEVYPNPLRPSQAQTGVNFNQLPPGARLRVYTLAGEKVKDLSANAGGFAVWDGKNHSGQNVASGVYIVYVQGEGQNRTLKVAVQR